MIKKAHLSIYFKAAIIMQGTPRFTQDLNLTADSLEVVKNEHNTRESKAFSLLKNISKIVKVWWPQFANFILNFKKKIITSDKVHFHVDDFAKCPNSRIQGAGSSYIIVVKNKKTHAFTTRHYWPGSTIQRLKECVCASKVVQVIVLFHA